MSNQKFKFTFKPRVVTDLLGSQLVESTGIAIAEQIKNSSDANATRVVITFEKNKITISDNGVGMSKNDISKYWFEIGTDNKNKDMEKVGGKGIGRLSLFSIGKSIKVASVTKKSKVDFSLNYEDIVDGILDVEYRTLKTDECDGTKIIIEDLIDEELDYEEIQNELENLFLTRKMDVKIILPKNVKKLIFLEENDVKTRALIDVTAEVKWNKEGGIDLKYISKMNGIDEFQFTTKCFSDDTIEKIKKVVDTYQLNKIGDIKFEALYFYKGTDFLRIINDYSDVSSSDLKKKYLSYNSGINIYRNNVKIFNYGSNDWLKLTHKRLNDSSKIDNELISGRIILQPISELYIVEKTNREGFMKSTPYKGLVAITKLIVEQINSDRKTYAKKCNIAKLDEYLAKKKEESSHNVDSTHDSGKSNDVNTSSQGKDDSFSDKNSFGDSGDNSKEKDSIPQNERSKSSEKPSVDTSSQGKDDSFSDKNSFGDSGDNSAEPPKTTPKASKQNKNDWRKIPGYSGTEYKFKNIVGASNLLNELSKLDIKKYKYLSQVSLRPILETSINEIYKVVSMESKKGFENKMNGIFEKLGNKSLVTDLCSDKFGMEKIDYNTMVQYLKQMKIKGTSGFTNITTHRVGEVIIELDRLQSYLQEVYVFSVMMDRWIEKSKCDSGNFNRT